LPDFAVVALGEAEGRDQALHQALKNLRDFGREKHWLYLAQCKVCDQHWMVAQEDRIHDNIYLKRLTAPAACEILEFGAWPSDFLKFEDVIRLGPDNGSFSVFLDPHAHLVTIKQLVEERRDISAADVAYLLCLSEKEAGMLMAKARKTSWSVLLPFA
jgi:hypothetical protein